jgi:hypothetical protein
LRDLHTGDALKGIVNRRKGEQKETTMSVGIRAEFGKENMMRLLRNSILGALVLSATAVALTPKSVLADKDKTVQIAGNFTVSLTRPSALDYCAGGPAGIAIEAQGIGKIAKLGPLFLTIKKCAVTDGNVVTYAGAFKMTAGNGDTMEGTYAGSGDRSLRDENGFGPFQGTLTLTGGTGKFIHTSGVLSFTAVSGPAAVGVTAATGTAMAFYLVQGNMVSPERH